MVDAPTTARARARAAMTEDIKELARAQLAAHGADGLSLRAVARELGVVSSAVYRYFPSRDDLLTALIIDAYDAVGDRAEAAAAGSAPARRRWQAVATAVRAWALHAPHEYALVYGTPVPGYRAPADTVDPAQRVNIAALGIVADGVADGSVAAGPATGLSPAVASSFAAVRAALGLELPDDVVGRALLAWTWVLGHISFELFGHLHRAVEDYDALWEAQLERMTELLFGAGT